MLIKIAPENSENRRETPQQAQHGPLLILHYPNAVMSMPRYHGDEANAGTIHLRYAYRMPRCQSFEREIS